MASSGNKTVKKEKKCGKLLAYFEEFAKSKPLLAKKLKHNGVSKLLAEKKGLTEVCYYWQRSTNNIKSFLVNSSVCQNISANLPQTVQFGKGRYYTK